MKNTPPIKFYMPKPGDVIKIIQPQKSITKHFFPEPPITPPKVDSIEITAENLALWESVWNNLELANTNTASLAKKLKKPIVNAKQKNGKTVIAKLKWLFKYLDLF